METTEMTNVSETTVNEQMNAAEQVSVEPQKKSGAGFGKVVMFGAVPGILLGAAGITAAASAVSDDFDGVVEDFKDAASDLFGSNDASAAEAEVETAAASAEEAGEVTGLAKAEVSDEMSFGAAFEAARSQVGPEGVFEWRGNYYSTYTKEEWDAMDTDARGEYMQKYYETDMNADAEEVGDVQGEAETMVEDTVDVVDVQEVAENMNVKDEFTVSQVQASAMIVETEDAEVGFVVEERTDSDVVFGETDGHDTMFADLDGDGMADYMVVDSNDDGEVDYDEVFNIEDEGISMDAVGSAGDVF